MRKELDSPVPSIRKLIIECDIPKNYGAYSYWYKPITDEGKHYDGIKKDKLPMDGGENYWSSSKNKEFFLAVQGDKEMFDLHITQCVPEEMYMDLRIQEDALLRKKYPDDIKNNNKTYNNAYGILPFSKEKLIVSKETYVYFKKMCETEWVQEEPELVENLMEMCMAQIRKKNKKSHESDIAKELLEIGCNTKNLKPILIFEGVGHIFKPDDPDWKNADVIVGKRHGLHGAARVNVQK